MIERLRQGGGEAGAAICILQDLQGPKSHAPAQRHKPVALKTGSHVTITARDVVGTPNLIPLRSKHWLGKWRSERV